MARILLNKLPEYNIDFNLSLPSHFNETLLFIFENDFHSDTLSFYDMNDFLQFLGDQHLFSHGEHKLTVISQNIFPEIVYFNVSSDTTINIDLKWKGISFVEEFNTSDLWTESSVWTFSNGFLKTQN